MVNDGDVILVFPFSLFSKFFLDFKQKFSIKRQKGLPLTHYFLIKLEK